jgi:hypothetical protein
MRRILGGVLVALLCATLLAPAPASATAVSIAPRMEITRERKVVTIMPKVLFTYGKKDILWLIPGMTPTATFPAKPESSVHLYLDITVSDEKKRAYQPKQVLFRQGPISEDTPDSKLIPLELTPDGWHLPVEVTEPTLQSVNLRIIYDERKRRAINLILFELGWTSRKETDSGFGTVILSSPCNVRPEPMWLAAWILRVAGFNLTGRTDATTGGFHIVGFDPNSPEFVKVREELAQIEQAARNEVVRKYQPPPSPPQTYNGPANGSGHGNGEVNGSGDPVENGNGVGNARTSAGKPAGEQPKHGAPPTTQRPAPTSPSTDISVATLPPSPAAASAAPPPVPEGDLDNSEDLQRFLNGGTPPMETPRPKPKSNERLSALAPVPPAINRPVLPTSRSPAPPPVNSRDWVELDTDYTLRQGAPTTVSGWLVKALAGTVEVRTEFLPQAGMTLAPKVIRLTTEPGKRLFFLSQEELSRLSRLIIRRLGPANRVIDQREFNLPGGEQ